jgi:hypothetical protein
MDVARTSKIFVFVGFAIWLVYGFLVGTRHWQQAVAFGLVASLCMILSEGSRDIKIKLLDWTVVGYFVLAGIATFILKSALFPVYSSIVIWALYAGVTWASIVRGQPFSLEYARESSPRELWETPSFLRANQVISAVWGAAFVINVGWVVLALRAAGDPLLLGVAAPLAMMGLCALFTSLYTKMSRRRAAAK